MRLFNKDEISNFKITAKIFNEILEFKYNGITPELLNKLVNMECNDDNYMTFSIDIDEVNNTNEFNVYIHYQNNILSISYVNNKLARLFYTCTDIEHMTNSLSIIDLSDNMEVAGNRLYVLHTTCDSEAFGLNYTDSYKDYYETYTHDKITGCYRYLLERMCGPEVRFTKRVNYQKNDNGKYTKAKAEVYKQEKFKDIAAEEVCEDILKYLGIKNEQ